MLTLLWIIYVLDCLLLIGIILLQPGEGSDLAAAFGGASSQTAFGARGSATFMQKLTTGLAVTFMVLSIVLVMLSNRKQSNLMEKSLPLAAPAQSAPATPKPAAQAPAPAATATKPAEQTPAPAPAAPAKPAPQPAPTQGTK
jgi:preprotein translocase subunit SecG